MSLDKNATRSIKIDHVSTKTAYILLRMAYSYTQGLSIHSISTGQYKQVCFSGGQFANPVKSQMRVLGGWDLKLLPLLARCLLDLVVWYT